MDWMIWTGAFVTLIGLAALVWCILLVARARREGLDEAAMKSRLQTLVALNMGALAVSAIGLMLVVIGILLG